MKPLPTNPPQDSARGRGGGGAGFTRNENKRRPLRHPGTQQVAGGAAVAQVRRLRLAPNGAWAWLRGRAGRRRGWSGRVDAAVQAREGAGGGRCGPEGEGHLPSA